MIANIDGDYTPMAHITQAPEKAHHALMQAGRACPELDARLFFDRDEIRGASLLAKRKPPAEPPTINDVLRLIATLGDFLAGKGGGEPGVETIWQRLQRTQDAALTIQSLRDASADSSCVQRHGPERMHLSAKVRAFVDFLGERPPGAGN